MMQKRMLLFLRFFLILATILVMTYSKKGIHFPEPGYIIALIYFFSNLVLYLFSETKLTNPVFSFFVFLFDIVTISLAIYFTQGFETDFYLIYLLAIFIASVNQDIGGSLPIAVVASILYGWLLYRSSPEISFWDTKILIRVPFIFIISLVSTYWAHAMRTELKKKEELERFNRELKKEVAKVVAEEIDIRKYTQKVINSVPSGVIATKRGGIISTFNPVAERVLGLKSEEVMGQNIKHIAELNPLCEKMRQSVVSGASLIRDEVEIINSNNKKIPIGMSISPISGIDEEDSGCVVIFIDLSEKRRLEEKLKQAERLSYLGKMASWVAHEIRNPLTSIDGFAQLLNRYTKKDKIALYSSEICKGTERINHMIDDILTFARTKRKVDYVDIHLGTLITSITNNIVNVKVTFFGDSSQVIKGEIESIRRAFINLITNSAEALAEDGHMEIRFSTNTTNKWTIVEISDNGRGISKENMRNLFTPFFTTKQRGTGLGLSIVKKIIDEHNGRIEIESEEGVGTTCRIYFLKEPEEEKND